MMHEIYVHYAEINQFAINAAIKKIAIHTLNCLRPDYKFKVNNIMFFSPLDFFIRLIQMLYSLGRLLQIRRQESAQHESLKEPNFREVHHSPSLLI